MKLKLPRVPRVVRNTVLSAVALLVLIAGGGVGYVWYTGQAAPEEVLAATNPEQETSTAARPVITPSKPAPDVPVGASVQALTSPVPPGSNANITIKTRPEATCTIKVTYDDVPSADSGLVDKQADAFGVVSWTWTVDRTAPAGEWPVDVTCAYGELSGFVRGKLQVE